MDIGGVYTEEDEETAGGGGGGRGGGRGVGGGGGGGGGVIETVPVENKARWWVGDIIMLLLLSWCVAVWLYLYLKISALTAFNSACRDCTWCCKAEIAPMHP